MTRRTVSIGEYRALAADARAALRMIREVVEQHAPPGSVPSEEMVEPPLVKEAEALVKGILAIAEATRRAPDRVTDVAESPSDQTKKSPVV